MRDYGYVNGNATDAPDYSDTKYTQVYMATHNGEGAGSRLPFMNRSFISFSFGSKKDGQGNDVPVYIEDFNLIATINGDRLERPGYADFEDLTSDYEVLDGHFYWGTHYTNHELEFELATDGITQRELDNFLHWFQPGKVHELILSEHPNRAVMARVGAAPSLHLLPFEQKTNKTIAGESYSTSTTLYKGEITLTLVMEEPYWYSKINIFGKYDEKTGAYRDIWIDANNKEVDIFKSPDAIKIALEDNIPIASMINDSMLLGNNTYANANITEGARTAGTDYSISQIDYFETKKIKVTLTDNKLSCFVYEPTTFTKAFPKGTITDEILGQDDIQLVDEQEKFTCYIDIKGNNTFSISYKYGDKEPVITTQGLWQSTESENSTEIMLNPNSGDIFTYFVNPGIEEYIQEQSRIAQVLEDTLEYIYGARIAGAIMSESSGIEEFAADDKQYFYYAGNAPSRPTIEFTLTPTFDRNGYINSPKNSYAEGTPYNTITFESLNKKELQFTTPSVYTGYNQVIKILLSVPNTESWVNIRKQIRNNVNHAAARAWANKVIDSFDTLTIGGNRQEPVKRMKWFLLNEKEEAFPSHFSINSKTGRAIGQMKYRVPDNNTITNWETYAVDAINDYSSMVHEEDVGDMIRSNYLIIEDQNQPTADGHIVAWVDTSDENRLHSHIIKHDVANGLKNVFIKYQNMYL